LFLLNPANGYLKSELTEAASKALKDLQTSARVATKERNKMANKNQKLAAQEK
jgi:hypothetical protein